MEKVTFSRTDISEDVLLQLAKTSELIKRLNSLTLVNYIQKQESDFGQLYPEARNCQGIVRIFW